jgi:hypothetical protein
LLRSVTPVNVEGEKAAVLAAEFVGKSLQLFLDIVAGGSVAFYESLDGGD